MAIPTCINYRGHVVYSDGRVYKNYELLITCASETSAKRWATINNRKLLAARSAQHHAAISRI